MSVLGVIVMNDWYFLVGKLVIMVDDLLEYFFIVFNLEDVSCWCLE